MPQDQGDELPQLTENRETLSRRPSEHEAFARTVENAQFSITNESVMEGNSSAPLCREYSEPKNSQHSRSVAILKDHVKINPVTGIEAFKCEETLVIEVQVPSRQPGSSKYSVCISRGKEQHARQFIPTETDHQISEAVLSPHSSSCGETRAQAIDEQTPARYELASKPKLESSGFSQRDGKNNPSKKQKRKRDSEFCNMSKQS